MEPNPSEGKTNEGLERLRVSFPANGKASEFALIPREGAFDDEPVDTPLQLGA